MSPGVEAGPAAGKRRERLGVEPIAVVEAGFHGSVAFYLRLGILAALALTAFGVLAFRLWSLQVVQGPKYAQATSRQAVRTFDLPMPRGSILDARGRLLAGTQGGVAVAADEGAAVIEPALDSADDVLDDRLDAERQLLHGAEREPAAAGLVAREARLVEQEHTGAGACEPVRRRRSGRPCTDHRDVEPLHRPKLQCGAPGVCPSGQRERAVNPSAQPTEVRILPPPLVEIAYEWRGSFTNDELNALHAEAFEHRVLDDDWVGQVEQHSLGWVCARASGALVGFVNVPWDGGLHAFILDTVVAQRAGRRGIGTQLVAVAAEEARAAGCEWLHVDFDDHLRPFYFEACGFTPTNGGLIALR